MKTSSASSNSANALISSQYKPRGESCTFHFRFAFYRHTVDHKHVVTQPIHFVKRSYLLSTRVRAAEDLVPDVIVWNQQTQQHNNTRTTQEHIVATE